MPTWLAYNLISRETSTSVVICDLFRQEIRMPRKPKSPTINELRRQLAAKERLLARALSRREKLLARLESIDEELRAIGGKIPVAKRRKRRKAARKPAKGVTKRKRAGRGKPLAEYIVRVLKGAEDGLRVKEIEAAVRKAGYKTRSKDFYGIVAATVREDSRFKKLRRGVYTLA